MMVQLFAPLLMLLWSLKRYSNPPPHERKKERKIQGVIDDHENFHFLITSTLFSLHFRDIQIVAEAIGTYFLIFVGCGAVAVNKIYGTITFPGVCVAWGLIFMVMVYSVGHISGAHFNPAVTIAFAIFRQFSYKQACPQFSSSSLKNVNDSIHSSVTASMSIFFFFLKTIMGC